MNYKVVYEIELDAKSPVEAAKEVYRWMIQGQAPVLNVTGKDGKSELIDLDKI